MALRSVTCSAHEELQPVIEPLLQCGRRQPADARGGELDRERQPVERSADVRDRIRVCARDGEIRLDGLRARLEQRYRFALRQAFEVVAALGRLQRKDGIDPLGGEAKRRAARHEELDVGRARRDSCDRRCGLDDMLEVVEHEQELAAPQMPAKILLERLAIGHADAKSLCGGGQDEILVLQRREADEHDAVGEIVEKPGGDLDRDSGLARPAGSGQRDEPDLRPLEHVGHLADLALPTYEGRGLGRQAHPRPRSAPRRCEAIRHCELGVVIQDLSLEVL